MAGKVSKSSNERLGITGLMRAAIDEDPTVLLRLLMTGQYEANLFVRDKKGRTALDWARMCRNYQAVSILMHAMTKGISDARLDAMHSPLELEVYIKETNKLQTTELFKAIRNRDVPYAKRILSENKLYREEVEGLGEVFFTDAAAHSGYTPLIIAAGFNLLEIVDMLLEYKTPIDAENKFGHTAFTYACAAGNSDIARMLLFFGADVHHKTKEGRTGLHYCCMYAKARTVKVILHFLLERFATFRIEGHSMIDFDPSRWTKYAEILDGLINTRDKNGKLATDLIPSAFPSGFAIETRLRVSGIKALPPLDQHPPDDRSVLVNRDFAQPSGDWDEASVVSDLADDISLGQDPVDGGEGVRVGKYGPFPAGEEGEDGQFSLGEQESARDSYRGNDAVEGGGGDGVGAGAGVGVRGHQRDRGGDDASRVSDVSSNTAVSLAAFTHDTDNLHAEGLHNLTDAHSIATAQPLVQEVTLINGLFRETRDRIRVWLDSARKESELMRLVPCPLNCNTMCKIETLTFHVRDDCPFRSLQCPLCHKMVRFIDLKQHNAKLCQKRPIACPNAYHGCCERITPDSIESHVMLKCKLRKMPCRQFCGAFVPYCKRENHELQHCKKRTISCDQCGESMVANTYTTHLHEHCVERLVRCSISCGLSFKAKDIAAHEQEVCVRPCRWNCGQRIGPPEQLAMHETTLCADKPVTCKYACGTAHLTMKDVRLHERQLCSQRPIACPHGCGVITTAALLPRHLEAFRGDCAERPVRCPSNLIGWRIMLLPENLEGIVLQYRRQTKLVDAVTGQPVAPLTSDGSQQTLTTTVSSTSTREEHVDQVFIRLEAQQVWVDYWSTKYVLLQKVQGDHLSKYEHIDHKFPCGWVNYSDLNEHLFYHCQNREIRLAGENDQKVRFIGQKTKFADAVHTAEKRLKFDHFVETEITQKSTDFCGYCSAEIDVLLMPAHHQNDCVEYLVKCPYICGDEVRRKELQRHLDEQCPKRLVLCVDCNSKDLWAEELAMHQLHQCDQRIVPCPLECEDQKVTACAVDTHTAKHCIMRPMQCSCGLTMKFKDLDEHQRLHCNDRYYYCPQGCGEMIKQENQEYHTEFQCTNKNFRYQKDVDCPNQCGAIMMIRDVLTHLSYHCPRRMVECTLNCGNTVQLDRLAAHMVFCPMRILPCEPGMHACDMPLHQWFHVEPRVHNPLPVASIFDNDSDDQSAYGDSVASAAPVDTTSVVSRDGKRVIQFSDIDLARAGLASPDHKLHTRSEILDELHATDAIVDIQSKRQIAKRIAKTDRLIRELVPDRPSDFSEDGKQVTLMAGKEVNIQFNKKGTLFESLRVQRGDQVSPRVEEGDSNPIYRGARSLASDSSVYHDGFQMKFHHHLRMHTCKLHHSTLIFSALRHHDFALMEQLCKQIKDSEDIDVENIYGDTALTLACRMGKLNFIELLVQHAADINKETSNGRTALIEAVKAPVENIPVIEYIIENGCLVNYKTAKHQRTALHWAKRMNRTKTIRILELAIIVQIQANKIFFAISTGKYEYVKDMIKEGEFFDPNGEAKYYAEMKRYADLEDDAHDMLERIKEKLAQRGNAADKALILSNEANEELAAAEEALETAFANEDAVNQRISREFALFEKISLRLTPVDIQEIAALHKPELLLRYAAFGYGIMFGVLDSDDWSPVTPCTVQNTLKWWPLFRKELAKPNEVVRKIQSFTLARLEGGRAVDLLFRAKQLYEDMVSFLDGEKRKRQQQNASGSSSAQSLRRSPLRASQTMSQLPTSPLLLEDSIAEPSELTMEGLPDRSVRAEIPDPDWDSDAEDPDTIEGTGTWVKGEWVPAVRKKEKWWEQPPSQEEKLSPSRTSGRNNAQLSKVQEHPKFVYLSDEVISGSVKSKPIEYGTVMSKPRTPGSRGGGGSASLNDGIAAAAGNGDLALVTAEDEAIMLEQQSDGGSSRASSRQSRRKSSKSVKMRSPSSKGGQLVRAKSMRESGRSRSSRRLRSESPVRSMLDIPVEEHLSVLDYEVYECLPFIETMMFMFKAIVRYQEDRENLIHCKAQTAKCSHQASDAREKSIVLRADYENEFNIRADHEAAMIEYMKKERFYKGRVKGNMEKVRVARLLNEVSMNGHTAISWAAAVGAYELVEEMLTHGATVGFPVPLLNLTATFLQKSYRIYRLNCAFRYKPHEDDDPDKPPPPKVDSIQFVRDMTLLKEERDKVLNKIIYMRSRTRFPIPEAVYAGKWEIVQRIYERRLYHAHFANTWIFPCAPFPYLRKLDKVYDHAKMNIREVLTYGMNDNAAGCYVAGLGWVGPNDHREPFGETQQKMAEILLDLHTKNSAFLAGRKRIRLLALERINQRTGERAMLRAIKAKDFRKCMELAEKRGITIDLETPEGYTVMLCAAEENVDATNHVYMRNDDGRECLAVEYLLDRMYYRPSVNLEGVVSGHNALIRATILSRAPVVEALLDRGADINYVNRAGRTALHYAAASGDAVCTRILIERFADKTIRDANGQTAYEIADSQNFSNIMKLLSQFKGGFLGPVQISRGRVNNIAKCPLGCGMNMAPREQEAHCIVCEWRPAKCPNDCGDDRLLHKEMPDHLERYCGRRILQCQECEVHYEARLKEKHDSELCTHRLVPCSLGCGYDCKLCDIPRHQVHCSWRIIPCPLGCAEDMRAKDSAFHVKEKCENRRVPCPFRCRGLVVCKLVPIHMETLCQNRPVACQFCGKTVTKQQQERHEQECDLRLTPCVDKCGAMVPHRLMSVHQLESCEHRYVECPQHCGVKVRVRNLDFHMSTQCPERMSPCENGCVVSEDVPADERVVVQVCAKVMHLHLKYDCPERLNRCSLCLEYVKAKHSAAHERDDCRKRIVPCRVQGCLKQLPIEDRENHERHTCRFRLVVCKQDCGELVPFIHSGIHMKNACRNRYLDCPIQCATRLRFHELEDHLTYECPRRHTLDLRRAESRTAAALAGLFLKSKSGVSTTAASSAGGSRSGSPQKERPTSGGSDGTMTPGRRQEVRQKVHNMSSAVSDSLKMLALGDRAWTSTVIGSRNQSGKGGKRKGGKTGGTAEQSPSRSNTPAAGAGGESGAK